MTKPARKRIQVFRPGTHTSAQGIELTFTADQVRAIAQNYDAENAPAPVVIGHPTMDGPAFGWAAAFSYDDKAERLEADLDQLAPEFVAAVESGAYRKVSIALFGPQHPANPKPGNYYPRHIGFLGAAPPAVTGLKPVNFAAGSDHDLLEIEFAAPPAAAWAVRDLFGRVRDWFIDKFGLEAADKALPSYLVESITPPADSPAYTAPPAVPAKTEEPSMTPEEIKALQERAAKLEAENKALADSAAAAARNAAFASATEFTAGMVKDGKLLPADAAALTAVLATVGTAAPVEFSAADGQKVTEAPGAVLRRVLSGVKPVMDVSGNSKTPPADDKRKGSHGFAAPTGVDVDPDQAKTYAAAKAHQAQHNCDFATALTAVQAAQG